MIRSSAAVLVLGGVLALAACTSSKGDGSSSHPPSKASPSASTSRSSAPVPSQHPVPKSVANQVAARKFVERTSCKATAHGWQAGGTARNTAAKPVSYAITVYFTTPKATVLDFARTTVKVPARATRNWTAAATFDAAPSMNCVLVGVARKA